MLLQRLVEYSERIPPTPVMYNKLVVKWIIDIDDNGNFLGMPPTSDSGKKNDRGKEFQTPHVMKASGIKAKLLADNGEYVIGKVRKDSDVEKVKERHSAFIRLIETAEQSTDEPTLQAITKFYQNGQVQKIILSDDFDPSHNITFRVNGIFPFDLPNVQRFWAKYSGAMGSEDKDEISDKDIMECIVCGKVKPVLRRLPFKIKNIPKGQKAGNALISANSSAFESYSLEESLIAPICHDDSEKFSKAANALLQDENTHIAVGPLVYIFWTKEDTGFSFASVLSKPNPSDVQALIESAYKGKEAAAVVDETKFYASAFSASGSRVAVRDWLETTVSYVKENLARWFKFQRIVDSYTGAEGLPFPLKGYLRKDNRWASGIIDDLAPLIQKRRDMDNLSPNIPKVFLHFALKGGLLPEWLLYQAVNRNRMEQNVTRSRAAIIKMVLLSRNNKNNEEGKMECLDLENRNPAYLCGRLLGVLEIVQVEAFKPSTINSTIVDRFYGTASSAPASVFGKLLRGVQPHLTKLRKEKHGTFEAMAKQLEEVQCGLTFYPKTLTLEEQGFFALGYYHQKAANRAGAIAYKQLQHNADKNKLDEKEK